jgi:hypothetical protein
VIVGTGPEAEHFTLHPQLLTSSSPIFEAMMTKDNFRESKEKVIKLPEDSPGAFAVFAHWLYTRRLPDCPMEEYDHTRQQIDLRAFVFGDKYSLPEFKNMTYKAVLSGFEEISRPSIEFMKLLYSYGAVTGKIQQYFVEFIVWQTLLDGDDVYLDDLDWLEEASEYVSKLAVAVMRAMAEGCNCKTVDDTPKNNPKYESCEDPKLNSTRKSMQT